MADTLKVLGQVAPGATTLTTLYTVPAATSVAASSIVVCNRGAATTFRVSIQIAGAADATKQYIYYDVPLPSTDTFIATIGITLAATDVVKVYAGSANTSFSLFGAEIT